MSRFKISLTVFGGFCAWYLAAFFGYRNWTNSTASDRLEVGCPAWYFVYPTRHAGERAAYWLFYPCIRIDWKREIAHDLG
jgi:hypothetical protein